MARTNQFYTVKDVLREAGISRNTLYNWERKKKIPSPKRNLYGHRVYTIQEFKAVVRYAKKVFLPIS
ncbi:MAG: MerR family DNA-binding transcriptional regulator [Calditrichaeota bacterium]|nr:MerR family DNA-binding transcriptional regulator [Calditrichota bacterium]